MRAWLLCAIPLGLAGCSQAIDASSAREASEALSAQAPGAWNDVWWLERASRALRGGAGLQPDEDPKALLAMGKDQIVQLFTNDPRFADTVLGFNLSVLGFRQDRIKKENGNYEDIVYEMPHAISSARAILEKGGDYFKLFDLQHPFYMGPLLRPANLDPADTQLAPEALRQKNIERMQSDLDQMIAVASAPSPNITALCTSFNEHTIKYIFSTSVLNLPLTFTRDVMFTQNWYGRINSACNGGPQAGFDFVGNLQGIKKQNALLASKLAEFESSNGYRTGDVGSIKAMDLGDFQLGYVHTPFTFTIQQALPNSSTNFNRKRAAYYLKHFFCDDLTPVNVEAPATHAGGAHATEASCLACHYKLDPMAGFFRDLGSKFHDYSAKSKIYFDDGANTVRSEYEKAWQPGPDDAHPWNAGYIRSSTKPARNSYGSTVDDLYRLLKTEPEVKRCLMQRLFAYLVSEHQTADGDYLDFLSEGFAADLATSGSAAALKRAAGKIVLSSSFGTRNADASTCYDYRPGHASANGVPCKVASIVSANCVKCHSSTSDEPYLDLSKWELQEDGLQGFPHLDEHGKKVPALSTYRQMLDRLSSSDPDERMPYKSEMPVEAREVLYQWLEQRLQNRVSQ